MLLLLLLLPLLPLLLMISIIIKIQVVDSEMKLTVAMARQILDSGDFYRENGEEGLLSQAFQCLSLNPDVNDHRMLARASDILNHRLLKPEERLVLLDAKRINVQSFARWGASGGPLLTTKQNRARSELLAGIYVRGFPMMARRGSEFLVEQGVKMQFIPVAKVIGGTTERLL